MPWSSHNTYPATHPNLTIPNARRAYQPSPHARTHEHTHTHTHTHTIPRAPSTTTPPPETLQTALGFLGARDLSRCACVSHYVAEATDGNGLWGDIFAYDYQLQAGTMSGGDAKEKYIRRYQDRAVRLVRQKRQRDREAVELRVGGKQRRLRAWLMWLMGFCATCCPVLMVLVFVALVVCKLDRVGSVGSAPMGAVFTPLWILCILGVVVFILACVAFTKRDVARTSVWNGQWDDMRGTMPGTFLRDVLRERKLAFGHACTWGILLLLVPIVLCVKLSYPASMHWSTALVPLWCFLLWWTASPCFRWTFVDNDHYIAFILITVLLWLPITAVCICLAVKLDGLHVPVRPYEGRDVWRERRRVLDDDYSTTTKLLHLP